MTSAPHRGARSPDGHAHRLSPGTHTVEMAQLAELDRALAGGAVLTAGELGLVGASVHDGSGRGLGAGAVLTDVVWDGAPAFPDVHAVFAAAPGASGEQRVDLHTAALRTLSHRLGLRHVWGVGPP